MIGGLRASMGYTGCKTIKNFQTKTKFIRISPASLTESHTHDVLVTAKHQIILLEVKLEYYKTLFFLSFFTFILSGQTSLNQISNDISNNALLIYETDKDEAILLSRQALVADPSNAYAWAVAGNILRKNKEFKKQRIF